MNLDTKVKDMHGIYMGEAICAMSEKLKLKSELDKKRNIKIKIHVHAYVQSVELGKKVKNWNLCTYTMHM